MKTLFLAMTAGAALVFFASDARAYPGGRGGGGGGVGGAVNNAEGGAERAVDGNNNQGNNNQDGSNFQGNGNQQGNLKAKSNSNDNNNKNNNNNNNRDNMGRGSYINRSEHLGDKDWDKHRVGALDESKYRDRKDNNWRYRHWGNEWWYWVPAGYWMYWHNGDWARYDDSYVDANENENTQNANSHGPYYEDQNGFYYLQNGRRVYDPQIRRVAG